MLIKSFSIALFIFSVPFLIAAQLNAGLSGFEGQSTQNSQNIGQSIGPVQNPQGAFTNSQLLNQQQQGLPNDNRQLISQGQGQQVSANNRQNGQLTNSGQGKELTGQLTNPAGQNQQRTGSFNNDQLNSPSAGQTQQGTVSLTYDQLNRLISQVQANQGEDFGMKCLMVIIKKGSQPNNAQFANSQAQKGLANENDQLTNTDQTNGQTNQGKGRPRVKITKLVAEIFMDDHQQQQQQQETAVVNGDASTANP